LARMLGRMLTKVNRNAISSWKGLPQSRVLPSETGHARTC